ISGNFVTWVETVTKRPTPAARARATTASRSGAKSGKSRWQCVSTSMAAFYAETAAKGTAVCGVAKARIAGARLAAKRSAPPRRIEAGHWYIQLRSPRSRRLARQKPAHPGHRAREDQEAEAEQAHAGRRAGADHDAVGRDAEPKNGPHGVAVGVEDFERVVRSAEEIRNGRALRRMHTGKPPDIFSIDVDQRVVI